MSELSERLREEGADAMRKHLSLGMHKLCAEAADEIDRLTAALEDEKWARKEQVDRLIAAASRESVNAGMLAALGEIADACERAAHPAAPMTLSEHHVTHLQEIAGKARAAIARAEAVPPPRHSDLVRLHALARAFYGRAYSSAEPHLSGARLIVGFDTLNEANDAQAAISSAPQPPADEGENCVGLSGTKQQAPRSSTVAAVCRDGCQYAKDVGMWPEHSCGSECQYTALFCSRCGGEGRLYSGHSNDPNPTDAGECPVCGGSGYERKEVEERGDGDAAPSTQRGSQNRTDEEASDREFHRLHALALAKQEGWCRGYERGRDDREKIRRLTELAYAPDGQEHRSLYFAEVADREKIRREALEEAAKVAKQYAEYPLGDPEVQDTLEAFRDGGMTYTTGGSDTASAIEKAILALSAPPQSKGG